MKLTSLSLLAVQAASLTLATPVLDTYPHPATIARRATPTGFAGGEPEDATGKGGPILGECFGRHLFRCSCFIILRYLGGTNHQIDLANPDNLGQQSTDAGTVPNLKWSFSDSKAKIFNGGWTREQVVTDLPSSPDIAAAQQHLKKGASRELHWHRVV